MSSAMPSETLLPRAKEVKRDWHCAVILQKELCIFSKNCQKQAQACRNKSIFKYHLKKYFQEQVGCFIFI
jgi:hypothetical protein